MNIQKTSELIYKHILREINGWDEDEINKLEQYDYLDDPIFIGIKSILSSQAKHMENKND